MNYVQIGIQAIRGPRGENLNAVPIYITEDDYIKNIRSKESQNGVENFVNYLAQEIKNRKVAKNE